VLKGYLWDFNFNFLFMQINETDVVVYRHGLLQFKYLDRDEIVNAYKRQIPICGKVTEVIKGGLKVKYGSLYGFLPASEIESRSTYKLDSYIGKAFEMKVIDLRKQKNSFVLSRRAWLFDSLEIGQKVKGTVKSVKDFGVFVDLGGIDGLIHKTELAWKRIRHPSEVISIGDEVEVKVIKVNREDGKISLSLKQMKSDPWENIEEKYPISSTVQGVVVNIVDFGAFLQLEEGVEGLLHISEMSSADGGKSPINLLNEGDEVEVVVLEVSKNSKRISLSMKQTEENLLKLLLEKYSDKSKN
ncbi:MAG: S1 RNA-binding domain-containing protein, partial [Candidatus Poribacteria bacterium]|nr:S1 RNA-binding domain-containing protein [Candidatus Poribacteria bacterium]